MNDQPRIDVMPESAWDDRQRTLLEEHRRRWGQVLGVVGTLAWHPALLERFTGLTDLFYVESRLDPRDRELVILRVAHRTSGAHTLSMHKERALEEGLLLKEIGALSGDLNAGFWSEREMSLLLAVDELEAGTFVSDATWARLSQWFVDVQLLELIVLVGTYRMLSGLTRSVKMHGLPGN